MNHVRFPNGENLRHSSMINVEKENNQREKKKDSWSFFSTEGKYIVFIAGVQRQESFNYKLTSYQKKKNYKLTFNSSSP